MTPQSNPDRAAVRPFAAVLPAAGTGTRMGGRKKPLLPLCGQPVLHHTIRRFLQVEGCAQIVPVLHADECAGGEVAAELKELFGIEKPVAGGPTRQASVLAGLEALDPVLELVLIHDAVRPLVDPGLIRRVAQAAWQSGAAIAAVPATDTVKEVADGQVIHRTPQRERLWFARTPQGFRREPILRAHRQARADNFCGTDDAQLVERRGGEVRVVEDTPDNIKITTEEDLAVAEAILRWQGTR